MPMEITTPGVGLPYEKCKDLRQRRSCITEFLNPKSANSELLAIYSSDYLLEKFWYWKELSTIQMWAATFSYCPIFLGLHAARILAWGAFNLRSNLEKKTEFKGSKPLSCFKRVLGPSLCCIWLLHSMGSDAGVDWPPPLPHDVQLAEAVAPSRKTLMEGIRKSLKDLGLQHSRNSITGVWHSIRSLLCVR